MGAVYLDIETFSEVDLKKVGTAVYAAHPSTQIVLCSYAIGDGEVHTWDTHDGTPLVGFLSPLVENPEVLFHAHNAYFERLLLAAAGIEIPVERWRCDMVHAMSLAFPGSLDKLGQAIGLADEQQKIKDGRRLVQKFCKPRTPTATKPHTRCTRDTDPEDWAAFVQYNRQDVIAERAADKRLSPWPMGASEWRYWHMDQKINDTGLPVDRALVDGARHCATLAKTELVAELRALTGLDNPNAVESLRSWVVGRGIAMPDLTKHTVATALEGELPADVRRALELRQQLGRSSVAKFDALERATNDDGRLRGCFQFYGASRTGRWAGRIFQPQNLPRGSLKPDELRAVVEQVRSGRSRVSMDALTSCIRSAIRAPQGKVLRVADLANIESRILGWLAHCDRMLHCFATDRDIYKDYATALLGKDYSEITKSERNYAKPPTLGCGYGLGATGLVAYADGMRVEMSVEQAGEAVDTFRDTYPEIPRLWKRLEAATMELVGERRGSIRVGLLTFTYEAPFLFMVLPSGRRLAYFKPRIEEKLAPWGDMVENVTYMGVDQVTNKWERVSTFGGKWVEQACQAISRDLLAHGLDEAIKIGFEVLGSTHDEIIAMTDEDDWLDHDVLSHCMTRMPDWGDSDLYLGAEGFSDVIYRKD